MATEKINWQPIVIFLFGALLTVVTGLTGLIYQNTIKTDEKISAILKEHELKLNDHEIRLTIIETRSEIIDNGSKKKAVACNFKCVFIVQSDQKKRKKFDAYEDEEDFPLFV